MRSEIGQVGLKRRLGPKNNTFLDVFLEVKKNEEKDRKQEQTAKSFGPVDGMESVSGEIIEGF